MAPTAQVVIVLMVGYVAGLPASLWGLGDIGKIPGGVWRHAADRPRHQWRIGLIGAYALGGWPAIVAALVWWRSRERADLLYEWAILMCVEAAVALVGSSHPRAGGGSGDRARRLRGDPVASSGGCADV